MIGFVSIAIAVTALANWSGYALSEAAVMGLFVGSWGGCGFGAMLGGTISFLRAEDQARAEALAATREGLHDSEPGPSRAGQIRDPATQPVQHHDVSR